MAQKYFVNSLAMLLVAAGCLPICCAAKMAPAPTVSERSQVIDYVRSLEHDPVAMDSLDKRMWLTEWIVQTPAIQVQECCKSLLSLDAVNPTYSNQLRMQALYSQAAFVLQHPKVKDKTLIQAAGLAGTLRAYRAIQRFDPTAKYPLLDDLMALQKHGKLQEYVQQQQQQHPNCTDD